MENAPQSEQLPRELALLSQDVLSLAKTYGGDSQKLLQLLRILEHLHREIRDNAFQAALPKNRQALYNLLRTIETERGWPYIPVMPLGEFLKQLDTILETGSSSLSSSEQQQEGDY